MNKLKVYEGFAGKGTFSEAFEELGIKHEIVGYCEIDKYASTAFSTIHNVSEELNGWDITTVDPNKLPDFDVFTHGSPCTNYSRAGDESGGDKNSGTASSLMWYSVEIISVKKPKYVLWENVPDVLSPKHKHNFDEYIDELDKLGYNSYYKIQNSLDFGIPQKRKRMYVVSIRKDIDDGEFYFPVPNISDIKLSDITDGIENPVIVEDFYANRDIREYDGYAPTIRSNRIGLKVYNKTLEDILEPDVEPPIYSNVYGGFGETEARVHPNYSPTIRTAKGGGHIPSVKLKDVLDKNVSENYFISEESTDRMVSEENDMNTLMFDICQVKREGKAREYNDYAPTLTARDYKDPRIINDTVLNNRSDEKPKLRKLTPLECFRLMDETDENFYKIKNSLLHKFYKGKDRADTQLYKIAGNSIVKRVLVEYYKVLFKEYINK